MRARKIRGGALGNWRPCRNTAGAPQRNDENGPTVGTQQSGSKSDKGRATLARYEQEAWTQVADFVRNSGFAWARMAFASR